jgi:hypothetical protein
MNQFVNGIQDMISKKNWRKTPYVDMDGVKIYYERIKE